MSNVSVKLSGFNELSMSLGEMSIRMSDAAARKAVRAAARPVINQARANLSALPFDDSTGLLKRSIGVKVKKYKGRTGSMRGVTGFAGSAKTQRMYAAAGVTVAIIGARKGFGQYVDRRARYLSRAMVDAPMIFRNSGTTRSVYSDPANYSHLIEGGVRPHHVGKGSSRRRGRGRGAIHPGFHAMPWLEPAIQSRRQECIGIMARVFREALMQEAARARAKTMRRAA